MTINIQRGVEGLPALDCHLVMINSASSVIVINQKVNI